MKTTQEIERKYEVDEKTVVPPLGDIATVVPSGEAHLEAEYFDTADGVLAAHNIVLRRRQGGADEGWHVKIPAPAGDRHAGRTEFTWALTDNGVPDGVLAPVLVHVRDREVGVIARMRTHRTMLRLVGEHGEQLVEVADDVVSASDVATGTLRIWREWEVELMDGAPTSRTEREALLGAIEERLVAAGARPAQSVSKLASALGRTSLSAPVTAPELRKKSSAADVLMIAIGALVEELKLIDPRVRRNETDSVHQLRTRLRRLRSLLASYRGVFDRAATDPIRAELQRVGLVLGEARDAEVMRDRAVGLVEGHDTVFDGVADRLVDGWDRKYSAAYDKVIAELSGKRYFRLLDALDKFVASPALVPGASDRGAAKEQLSGALEAELKRVLVRAKRARAADTEQERILLLHDTRKAAKRLRYAAEAVSLGDAAIFGGHVRRLAAAAEAVHDLLGEHRDSVLMQQHLRATAGAGEHSFDFGVLHEVERLSAALCLAEYPAALSKLKSFR